MPAWDDAFNLLSMYCPCSAFEIVTTGLQATPLDQIEVADGWMQLGTCINAILDAVTPQ